ncbi:hypothetical protein ROG8370_01630 [Roseovarius gaetbuli]|uniref:Surface lipoprotein assembly modifier C-terminal domain-containing protein n=1 Tax=Roseovarius gaetbuli TaxID=1356575 RepID=A0A1X6Z3J2_9RHOB|nr:surface lipoprotein assembly modifier [Roseovarius gaetbuli]SLN39382.1 hypothetical protein ROG8370_01630 [Roseovarius gaetbuli]
MARGPFSLIAAALLAACLSLPGAAVKAEEKRLSIPEARVFAAELLNNRRPRAARAVARGILKSDENDYVALLILSRAELSLGNAEESEKIAKQAFRVAETDNDRFTSSYTVSQALLSGEKYTQAQLWSRRSAEAAPKDSMRRAAVNTFQQARNANPWNVQIGLRFAPSSNVNNGPSSNRLEIGGLVFIDPAAVPLSGYEVGADVEVTRRFDLSNTLRFSAGLRVDERQFILSDSAKRKVPTASGNDYDFRAIELKLRFDHAQSNGRARMTYDLIQGRNWSGGDLLSDYTRFEVGRDASVSPRMVLGAKLGVEHQERKDVSARSADIIDLTGRLHYKLRDNGAVGVQLTLSDTASKSASIEHQAAQVFGYYSPGDVGKGVVPTFSVAYLARDFDQPLLTTTKRRDRRTTLGVSVLLSEMDYFGFAPTVGVNATKNTSNISLFKSEEFGLTLGLKSVF